jgi:hypothetical protein
MSRRASIPRASLVRRTALLGFDGGVRALGGPDVELLAAL